MRKRKGRSALQKAQLISSRSQIWTSNKENTGPAAGLQDAVPAVDFYAAKSELDQQRNRAQDYERRFRNTRRQVLRAHSSQTHTLGQLQMTRTESAVKLAEAAESNKTLTEAISSVEESAESQQQLLVQTQKLLAKVEQHNAVLKKTVDKLRKRSERAPVAKALAVKKAVAQTSQAVSHSQTYHIKEKGVITDDSRVIARELVNRFGVPVAHVNDVIHTVAKPLGVKVSGNISKRTVSRTVLEGGVAAKLQLVQEFHNADSMSFFSTSILIAEE